MLRSRSVSLVLMVVFGALPLAPQAHVHDVLGTDGHEHRVAHSHRESHSQDLAGLHPPHGAALDHEGSVVATFDPVFRVPPDQVLAAPVATAVGLILEPPVVRRLARSGFVERLIHGPPRAPAEPRGPPSPALL